MNYFRDVKLAQAGAKITVTIECANHETAQRLAKTWQHDIDRYGVFNTNIVIPEQYRKQT